MTPLSKITAAAVLTVGSLVALSAGAQDYAETPGIDALMANLDSERALFNAYGRDGNAVAQLMDELKTNGTYHVSQGALEALRDHFASGRASEDETSATIARLWRETGELLCPHSAVGVHVACETRDRSEPMVTLATAHPAKFPDAVEAATGIRPPLPERMADLFERNERITRVPNELDALETLIEERIRT